MIKYFTYSILLHFILITLCFFSLNLLQTPKNTGNKSKINAYIYIPQLFSSAVNDDKTKSNNLSDAAKAVVIKNSQILSHQSKLLRKNKADNFSKLNVIGTNAKLLEILHDLIQQKILDFIGDIHNISDKTTTLNFTLYPDGYIKNLTIKKSSGIIILDEIAKNAVNEIQPVESAKKLITEKYPMQIDIIFKKE